MPDKKKISELTSASALNNGDLFVVSQDNGDTTYTSKKTEMLEVGKKLLNGIDYTTLLDTTSKKPIGAINELRDLIIGQLPVVTESGSLASFTTSLALPLVSLKANITATQSGTGTPSPSNPRPISGFSSVRLWQVSQYAQYFQGLLLGTYGFVDLSTLTWTTTSWGAYKATPDNCKAVNNANTANVISENYTATSYNNQNTNKPNNSISVSSTANIYIVSDSSPSGYVIYELATPITPTITDAEFETLCQAFGISGDAITISLGDTYYGGVLDCKNGTAVITHACVNLSDYVNSFTRNANQNNPNGTIYQLEQEVIFKGWTLGGSDDAICSHLQKSSTASVATANANSFYWTTARTGYRIIYGLANGGSTLEDLQTFLNNNNVIVCGELETPITLTGLTPDNFTTLVGQNNIFANSGDVELSFKQGIQEYIDNQIATTQALIL